MTLSWHDKLEIRELVARYDHAIDSGDPEGWAATFTEDGSWNGGVVVSGQAELLAFARGLPANPAFAAFRPSFHFFANVLVEETTPGEARLLCDNLMLQPRAGAGVAALTAAGYDDIVRRVDGRWLFASRRWRPVRLS